MGLSDTVYASNYAVVQAAAGTGKTWLLTARVIRLLLDGTDPGSILAITFTRKAAAEMHQRLRERLYAMAAATGASLDALLCEAGVDPSPAARAAARGLYESLLAASQPLRTTTFHAFCHEILQRFPLEAGVPPGFDLCERTSEPEAAAWRALERELTRNPGDAVAQALDLLLRRAGSVQTVRAALAAFLRHRSDWWFYTEGASDAVADATDRLPAVLNTAPGSDPAAVLLADPSLRADLAAYAELLGRHSTTNHAAWLAHIHAALAPQVPVSTAYVGLRAAFLTAEDQPRKLKATNVLTEKLGTAGVARLQALHARIVRWLHATEDERRRRATYEISAAWYRCGQRLLELFQQLKREQHVLDFVDLEWHTYRLLTHGQHAEWVQYKLDRRIAHLLVDEFQDTNPTQWRLLLPLLVEMTAGDSARPRSAFLVGDQKQSIYRFRRAEPRLFDAARDWLTQHARASIFTQHVSWRSAPAVIHFINMIFDRPSEALADTGTDLVLNDFRTHEARHTALWGIAELLPLIPRAPSTGAAVGVRDPLTQPRVVDEDQRHRREGDMIATRINALVGQIIQDGQASRPLDYGDIMVLLRDRTHAAEYEAALRYAGIPYVGAERGGFVRCLEVRDMVHLLTVLTTPDHDVALASVLRAPIFAAGDVDLMEIAEQDTAACWYERLLRMNDQPADSPLGRAQRLLPAWQKAADRVPVHDLLDRIYCEGDITARYQSAAPPHLKARVVANLHRLLALALEVDAGRFPSLARFVTRLDALTAEDSDADAWPSEAGGQAVRVMTIHAAKGLEAPAVFLANAAQPLGGRDRGMHALVEWPVEDPRPRYFHLIGKKDTWDDISRAVLRRHERAVRREEANLLYVALTRAKQVLYVSGCEPARDTAEPGTAFRRARGWYGFIEERLENAAANGNAERSGLRIARTPDAVGTGGYNVYGGIESGARPVATGTPPGAAPATIAIDPALTRPLADAGGIAGTVAPSDVAAAADDRPQIGVAFERLAAAKRRGVVLHRMLELLGGTGADGRRTAIRERIEQEWGGRASRDWLDECWREACAVMDHPAFRAYFDAAQCQDARNEVTVLYREGGRQVYGIVDRLVLRADEVVVIDYKTHRVDAHERRMLAERFGGQLRLYAAGVQRLWPGRRVRALLLFTHSREAIEVGLSRT